VSGLEMADIPLQRARAGENTLDAAIRIGHPGMRGYPSANKHPSRV